MAVRQLDSYAAKHVRRMEGVQVSVGLDKDRNVCLMIDDGSNNFLIPFNAAAAQQLGGHLVTAASQIHRMAKVESPS